MKIGGYETVRLLGRGGMSEVYEAENPRLGSRHAAKLFTYEKDDAEVSERFRTEGRLLAKLNHPRIVRVTDFGTDEASGRPFFVMDLVLDERGEVRSLADVQPGTVDEEVIGRWYDDLREGLAYIHANGVIHRDLKLQNVLVGPDGHAVLTDFGISKIFDVKGDGVQIVDTVKTLVKMREGRSLVMGSVGYMAPELEMGVAASPQSDWYALGVIIYRLLTGTWCDARTDISGNLETYDPVWRRILPKLLHANPNGRECLSYADAKREDREKAEFEAEERWLKEKGRGHFARHVARYLGVALVALAAAGAWTLWSLRTTRAELAAVRAMPNFETLFEIPAGAGEDETDRMPSREQFRGALIDAQVLTHEIFADLRDGVITRAKAEGDLKALAARLRQDDSDVFDSLPDGYTSSGEDEALRRLFADALKRFAK